MKCAVVIITVYFVYCQASSQEAKELEKKLEASVKKCGQINNVTSEQVRKIKKLVLPLDLNIQCTIACMAKELEIMNGDNSLDRVKIASLAMIVVKDLNEAGREQLVQKGVEILEICLKLYNSNKDECISANNFAECYMENAKKNGLFDSL